MKESTGIHLAGKAYDYILIIIAAAYVIGFFLL